MIIKNNNQSPQPVQDAPGMAFPMIDFSFAPPPPPVQPPAPYYPPPQQQHAQPPWAPIVDESGRPSVRVGGPCPDPTVYEVALSTSASSLGLTASTEPRHSPFASHSAPGTWSAPIVDPAAPLIDFGGGSMGSSSIPPPTANVPGMAAQPPPSDAKPHKQLIVGNLPPQCSEMQLRQLFEQFGQVETAKLMFYKNTNVPKGYGFVYYRHLEHAIRAQQWLQDFELYDRRISISFSAPKK